MNDESEPQRRKVPAVNKADGKLFNPKCRRQKFLRRRKNRAERRAAKSNPETQPMYGKFKGWDA